MIYYPLSVLMLAGIRDILIISTPEDIGSYKRLLGDGSDFGIYLSYEVQKSPDGLAQAFIIGERFIGKNSVCLVLGDNVFYGQGFTSTLKNARKKIETEGGAVVFGYYVKDPSSFGVVEFDATGKAISIEEKPKMPKSHYAVPGLYFYDNSVIDIAKNVKPSARGEIEITSVNANYLAQNKLHVEVLGRGLAWLDTGTYEDLLDAANYIATIQKRQGMYVSCIEEIAYRNKWLSKDALLELADAYKTEYGAYLRFIAETF